MGGDDDASAPSKTDAGAMPDKQDSEKPEGETALLSKSMFGGKDVEPGGECTFKVVAVHDDEVEVEYVPHDDEGAEGESPMGNSHRKIEMMAE